MKKKHLLGKYIQLGHVLGKGAFGEVFEACRVQNPLPRNAVASKSPQDPIDIENFPSVFAVKVIRAKHCRGITLVEIEREMSIVEKLRHPHIVGNLMSWVEDGAGEHHGSFCIAMELCEGGDLHRYISQHRQKKKYVKPESIVRIMAHVLAALNYSHSKGVIHRDIKPGNVFLVFDLEPSRKRNFVRKVSIDPTEEKPPKAVVGDLGLSRPLEYSAEMVKSRVGTPGYLSPEIVKGKPYNFKTDIFSAGVLMFELMTLERPFWKPYYTNSNVFWSTVSVDPIPRLRECCEKWAGSKLCDLVGKMLSKNPKDRPSSYEALFFFSSRIKRVIDNESIKIISDDVFLAQPRSAAVLEQASLKPGEVLEKPKRPPVSPCTTPERSHQVSPTKFKRCDPAADIKLTPPILSPRKTEEKCSKVATSAVGLAGLLKDIFASEGQNDERLVSVMHFLMNDKDSASPDDSALLTSVKGNTELFVALKFVALKVPREAKAEQRIASFLSSQRQIDELKDLKPDVRAMLNATLLG